ncbi:MAG: D-glycerate dehydrogenase [Candidatus Curtissbacteria bacterium]|nr:D-glycerate dehydrogenase [Candidatus Curtissbacteria bacterium]
MRKIYITVKIPDLAFELLTKKGYRVDINKGPSRLNRQELCEVFSKYEAVITTVGDIIDEEVIDSASKELVIISNFAVGFDNINALYAKRHGIVVTNTPGVAGESVAEHAFMLILAATKKLIEADKFVRRGRYHQWDPMAFVTPQIWGKTIGIVGLGRIGTYVGHIAYGGFRMNILYYDIARSEDFEMLTEAKYCKLELLLKEADIVSLHVPLAPATHHLIGKKELALMKPGAILINTARGPVIDEKALIWALTNKKIAAAGLDVYEHEPNIPHELTTMGNVILTPHIASATLETREAMAKLAAENIIAVFEGRNPPGLIKIS